MDHSMRARGRNGSTFHSRFYGLKIFGCKTVSSWPKLGPRQCLGFPDKFPMQPLRVAFEDARMNRIENVIVEIGNWALALVIAIGSACSRLVRTSLGSRSCPDAAVGESAQKISHESDKNKGAWDQ
jgi:hypothetical protein